MTPVPARDRYDVVIVGAGAFGLASAYHLAGARPELRILVVDALDGPGQGSMGASNAMVRDVFSSPDNHRLAKNAIGFYRRQMELREELRSPTPLVDLYGYLWMLPERARAEYRQILGASEHSIDAEWVDLDALETCPGLTAAPTRWFEGDPGPAPEPIVAGLFGRNCGAVAPDLLAKFYHEAAAALGVEFRFGTTVRRLSFEGREEILLHERTQRPFAFQEQIPGRLRIARVDLGDGRSVATDRVVVACGAWGDRLLHPLGIATACTPRPETLFSVSGRAVEELLDWRPDVRAVDTVQGRARFPFVILPTGGMLKPIFAQRHLWVGCLDTVAHPIGTREDPPTEGRLDYSMAAMGDRDAFATDVLPTVTPYLPRLEGDGVRLENSWGGYYSFSPDGLPVVTESSYGVIFVGGDSGSGVMKADSLGRVVTAVFEGHADAKLSSGDSYRVDRLSLEHRAAERERIIL